jgi:hypothetical protein
VPELRRRAGRAAAEVVGVNLPSEARGALRLVLSQQPQVRRAIFVRTGEKPTIVFEYDERPPSVAAAQSTIDDLVAVVTPALGAFAYQCGISAGGPEEIARFASAGEVVYERE